MLILDRQLALERMVEVASTPAVPETYKRSHTEIEAITAHADGDGPSQRRLARVLVLAAAYSSHPVHEAADAAAQDARFGPSAPTSGSEETLACEHTPAALLLQLTDPAPDRPGLWQRALRSLAGPPLTQPAEDAPRPHAQRETVRVRSWHMGPVDLG